MKKTFAVFALSAVLALALAAPAFAATGPGAGFGQHHATHAQEMGGFTGMENPGMHQGFAGWTAP